MNKPKLNEWIWSEKDGKWVYIELKDGKEVYTYSEKPPKKFMELSNEIIKLNKKLLEEKEYEKNIKLYKKMMALSKKMQEMRIDPE